MSVRKENLKYAAAAVVGGLGLYFFYLKYVPIVRPFQVILLPVLSLLVILTVSSLEAGTLFFLFAFPLSGNLPYYFGIDASVPHAPIGLVLFLFYFWGWIIRKTLGRETVLVAPSPVLRPMAIAAWLVAVSGIITFLRFGNFYPFLSDGLYELVTNVNGVTSGGAQMSTVFHSLNYLSEFGFFLILGSVLIARDFARKAVIIVGLSLFFSLGFAFFQHFEDPGLGNTGFWVRLNQINSTFSDPNAFAAFLAIAGPLLLGASFGFKGWWRVFFGAAFAGTLFVFPFTGVRSALLGLGVAILVFLWLALRAQTSSEREAGRRRRRAALWAGASLIALVFIVFGALSFRNARVAERLKKNWHDFQANKRLVVLSPERFFLWKAAVEMGRDYPASGVGVGTYIIGLPNTYTEDERDYPFGLEAFRRNDSAENYFLHVFAELGFPGLLLFLWIFWMVLKEIRSGLRRLAAREENPYILFGAVAGVASYFINILFHSYIGSFETKFIFWLLVGLIVCWGRKPDEVEQAARPGFLLTKRQKWAAFVFLAFFGSVHLWNSTHSLSLASQTARYGLKQNFGFYRVETGGDGREFRWTREYGGMTIKIEKPMLRIPLLAAHPDIQRNPVKVNIYLVEDFFKQKKLLGELTLNQSVWETYEYSLPDEVGQEIILLFKVNRTWNPLKTTGAHDPRNLGVAVGDITFR